MEEDTQRSGQPLEESGYPDQESSDEVHYTAFTGSTYIRNFLNGILEHKRFGVRLYVFSDPVYQLVVAKGFGICQNC